MDIESIIKEIKAKSEGRTRYVGQKPIWDELLVAEIDRVRRKVDYAIEVLSEMEVDWREAAEIEYEQGDVGDSEFSEGIADELLEMLRVLKEG